MTTPGATGNYPDGMLNRRDEGELQIAVYVQKRRVVLDFGKPTAWIGLRRHEALAIADALRMHAENAD